jgi:hypothetical protein
LGIESAVFLEFCFGFNISWTRDRLHNITA